MPRKVILDVDPGIDDAMALSAALFDPRLEVVAVTAVAGNVPAPQATRNLQAIIEQLDPPRWPRLGAASDPDYGLPVDGRYMHDVDGLGGVGFDVAELHRMHPSEKVLADAIRAEPEAITIVALGPLTNIARALQRDPDLQGMVGQIVIVGGAVTGSGNITPAAEFNIYCDPDSAQAVFRSRTTKTLIPLDVTNQVVLTFDFLNGLPEEATKVGGFLRKILPPAFRIYRQQFGLEGIHCHDTVGLMAVTDPELFTMQEMPGDVETMGELTTGATVFDRRRLPASKKNMDVAVRLETEKVIPRIVESLHNAARLAGPKR